jgi:hypothetical protein
MEHSLGFDDYKSTVSMESSGKARRNRRFPGTVHTPLQCTPLQSIINTTSRRDISITMKAINEAITFLRSYDAPNVSEPARRFSVHRSTLSKRFPGKTGSKVKANGMKQLLTKKQELVLVNHIIRLCEWCLLPTLAIVTT